MKITDSLYFYSKDKPVSNFLGRGFSANIYALDQGNEIWLIDAGVCSLGRPQRIIRAMQRDGLDPKKIRKIFLTHAHPDHANGAYYFAQTFSCQIYIHEIEANRLYGRDNFFWEDQIEGARGLIQDFFPVPVWLAKWFVKYSMGSIPQFKNLNRFKDEEIFIGKKSDIQVIFTPGHTPGHCGFYCPQMRAFFCGDLIDPSFDHKSSLNFSTSDFSDIYHSIQKVLKLNILYFCSAHGKEVILGEQKSQELCLGSIAKLDFAKKRTVDLLRAAGNKGMRISEFYGKFPKQTWTLQDQMCVPFCVIKVLETEDRVKFQTPRFYFIPEK
jgi:glyoxylase-like metal-dependent hydrolase (beta-lactamase superfamily II)